MEQILYIDSCTYEDYDKVVKFLLAHDVPIVSRDKRKMVVAAEISKELAKQMLNEVNFEETVSTGETPLG